MTEVATTAFAHYFDSPHAETVVFLVTDRIVGKRLVEGWPAGAGVELGAPSRKPGTRDLLPVEHLCLRGNGSSDHDVFRQYAPPA